MVKKENDVFCVKFLKANEVTAIIKKVESESEKK